MTKKLEITIKNLTIVLNYLFNIITLKLTALYFYTDKESMADVLSANIDYKWIIYPIRYEVTLMTVAVQ